MKRFRQLVLALSAWFVFALPAHAVLVEITVDGDLSLSGSPDTYSLDGADFSALYRYDTTASPTNTTSGSDFERAAYDPILAEIAFSNRPGGASDTTANYQSTFALLTSANVFPPATINDNFGVENLDLSGTFSNLTGPTISFDLGSQDFFAGTSLPPLPVFNAADVTLFISPFEDRTRLVDYIVSNETFAINVINGVPLPATLWLFGVALAALLWARWRMI